jgi:hypothetical protein
MSSFFGTPITLSVALRLITAACTLATAATACAAQHTAPPLVAAAVANDDAFVATAFRALLDEVIGDSADIVCLSVARASDGSVDVDPSSGVMHSLRGGPAKVLPRSACAADERNFGNPRGLLRLKDFARFDEHMLIVHADAVGDHTARYECTVPFPRTGQRARCRITSRD